MADQHRWFKLWYTALSDDALQALAPAQRWAWAALGAYTKAHGTRGRVLVSPTNATLAAQMGVTVEGLRACISAFPNVSVSDAHEEGTSRHGVFTVTWANWIQYQEDSTRAERARASRSKRRGEKSREDKRRSTPLRGVGDAPATVTDTAPHPPDNGARPATSSASPPVVFRIPVSVASALDRAPKLGAVRKLREPAWWQAEVRANPGVDFGAEVLKAEAWMVSNPAKAPRSDIPRFLHTWLGRAERVEA